MDIIGTTYVTEEFDAVEGTVGMEKQNAGKKCTDEESNDKKYICTNNSVFSLTAQNSLLDPAMAVMDIDQITLDIPNLNSCNI